MNVDEIGGSNGEVDSDVKSVVVTNGRLIMNTPATRKSCVFNDGKNAVVGQRCRVLYFPMRELGLEPDTFGLGAQHASH